MAASYRLSRWRRLLNALVKTLLRVGLGPRHTYLLTVRGRRTGTRDSTPVTLVEESTHRWLVAPYGEVAWVRNARAAGQVTLSRGAPIRDRWACRTRARRTRAGSETVCDRGPDHPSIL